MEPIDLLALNRSSRSYGVRNTFLGRQVTFPRCSKRWDIEGGPSFPRLCAAPADVLPWDMSRRHGFKHDDKRISGRIPVEFSIVSGPSEKHRHGCRFSVEAVLWSVDTYPDPYALTRSIFDYYSEYTVNELREYVALRGCFRAISDTEHTPESLKGADYKECIIVYDPRRSRGWLGEVAEVEELPACGLIADFYVLTEIASKFAGGFMETHTPAGTTHWGRLSGGSNGSWISCDAVRDGEQEWKYAPEKENWSLNLIGVRYVNEDNVHWHKLVGDAFLCSDGTVLHSYYFSRKEWGENKHIPEEWKEGYYHNRFYPKGSPMIPRHITESFEREMPAWFYSVERGARGKC